MSNNMEDSDENYDIKSFLRFSIPCLNSCKILCNHFVYFSYFISVEWWFLYKSCIFIMNYRCYVCGWLVIIVKISMINTLKLWFLQSTIFSTSYTCFLTTLELVKIYLLSEKITLTLSLRCIPFFAVSTKYP